MASRARRGGGISRTGWITRMCTSTRRRDRAVMEPALLHGRSCRPVRGLGDRAHPSVVAGGRRNQQPIVHGLRVRGLGRRDWFRGARWIDSRVGRTDLYRWDQRVPGDILGAGTDRSRCVGGRGRHAQQLVDRGVRQHEGCDTAVFGGRMHMCALTAEDGTQQRIMTKITACFGRGEVDLTRSSVFLRPGPINEIIGGRGGSVLAMAGPRRPTPRAVRITGY